jgi:pimeloyl-ACP methyl ester carboxylesterase
MNIIKINKHNTESLVFLNPMASDSCFWKNNLPDELANKYEIIFINYSGYNSPFVELQSFQDLSNYVHTEVLSKLKKPFHLIGYSYGGFLAQHLLKNNYSNLKSTILIGCSYKLTPKDKETASVLKNIIEQDLYLFCRTLTLLSHSPEDLNKNPLMGLQKFSNLKLAIERKESIIQQLDHILKLKEIQHTIHLGKSMVLYGENDKMIDTATIETFNNFFKDLEIIRLPNESHMIDSDIMYYHITQFLNNL